MKVHASLSNASFLSNALSWTPEIKPQVSNRSFKVCVFERESEVKITNNRTNYYLNTNEIPGELSRKNLISSHVKITRYLHTWKCHGCYGYIINSTFHAKKLLEWNGWYFIGVYIINRTLHGGLEIRNFSSSVEKYFIFPAQPFNILYLLHILNACIHLIVSGCMRVDASFPDRNTASLCPLSMASIHSSYSAYKDGSTPLKLEDF